MNKSLFLLTSFLVSCGSPIPHANKIDNFETPIENRSNFSFNIPDEPKEKEEVWEIPYVCDRFEYVANEKKSHYRRIRGKWTNKDKARNRKLARMVAHEMGTDSRYLEIAMERGSGFNPHAIHILNPDLSAHKNAYSDYFWSKNKEGILRSIIENGPKTKGYYKARRDLKRISIYKDNPFYKRDIRYYIITKEGERHLSRMPFFHYGYGPLDMNSVYYTKKWDKNAPPWIMCNNDGIVAFITMIWSLREYQEECGDSWGVIDRRYARGKCQKEASQAFRRRARNQKAGLDPDAPANLGKKYSRHTTDRKKMLEHMVSLAEKECLFSEGNKECLESKKTKK